MVSNLFLSCAIALVLLQVVLPQQVWSNRIDSSQARPLAEFTQTEAEGWLNSRPLSVRDLKGKVILIDFWTFDCWNCYRSFPWLSAMEHRLRGKDFMVIGIHSPEFEHEKVRTAVVSKVKEFGLRHPIMIDNDRNYWKKMDNRYWPAYYLVDKQGLIRGLYIGETHEGDQRAKAIESQIIDLLEE